MRANKPLMEKGMYALSLTHIRQLIGGVLLTVAVAVPSVAACAEIGDTPPTPTALANKIRVVKFNDNNNAGAAQSVGMLQDFALSTGYSVEWINVHRSAEAHALLLSGKADLSISSIPIDRRDDDRILASEPLGLRRFRVIGQLNATIESPLDLDGVSLAVKLSSPMWPYLDRLRKVLPDLRLQVLPDDLPRDAVLQRVSDGIYDAALVVGENGDGAIEEFPRTKYLFDLTGPQTVSWYAPRERAALVDDVNLFIERFHTLYYKPDGRLKSFDEIKQRGQLTVVTRFDGNNYFLKRGKPSGFELGLARRFAARHGLRLEVLVGRDDAEIIEWLRQGVGDLITARIDGRALHGDPGFEMSREYRFDPAVLVGTERNPLNSTAALAGTNLAAYQDHLNFETLQRFAKASNVIPVSPKLSLSLLLQRLDDGQIDGVLIDAPHLPAVLKAFPNLRAGMSMPSPYRYRWTQRGGDRRFADAIDRFLQSEYRKETYNVLEHQFVRAKKLPLKRTHDISPFDELLRDYADRYGFDWRLIAAQMFQESKFNPNAVSDAGALGLMQLMPATAQSMGFDNPRDPEAGIHAGVKYLNRLRNRFDNTIPMHERTWFALAAYNIGYDRIRRARNKAREEGLNQNKWFGNVETALRKMTQASAARRCHCGQAIVYVRAIRSLYFAYRNTELVGKLPGDVRGLSTKKLRATILADNGDGAG